MLSFAFRASRKRDLLIDGFFAAIRTETSPRQIVDSFLPLLAEMTSSPKDKSLSDALESGFALLDTRLPREAFVMVALHVMGKTNHVNMNSRAAREIAFGHIQAHFQDTLQNAAKQDSNNQVVGLIFAARSVVLSSLEAGNLTEAHHIVADLQAAVNAINEDEEAPRIVNAGSVVTIQQTLLEIGHLSVDRAELGARP